MYKHHTKLVIGIFIVLSNNKVYQSNSNGLFMKWALLSNLSDVGCEPLTHEENLLIGTTHWCDHSITDLL